MSNKIIIRTAVESDSDAILNFLRDSYYPEEPLTKALEPFQQADEDEQFNLSCIKHGTCLIAYYDNFDVDSSSATITTTIETISTISTSTPTSSIVTINSSSTIGNNNKNKNDVDDDDYNSKMNFLNHEARNQHQKTDSCNQHENKKKNIECNSNQCNQHYHSYNHQQQNLLNNTLKLNATEQPVIEQQQQQQKQEQQYNHDQNEQYKKQQNKSIVVKELLGVLIAGPKYPGEAEHLMDASNTVKSIKWSKMLKLLSYLELKSNVFNKFNCQSAVHCHAMATNRLTRGKSIGIKMLKEFIKICKKLQYPVITLDCTSIYSIRLCEKLNMICLNELKFDDYRNDFGEQVFRPPLPHNIIKTFAKKISDNINDDD